MKVSLKEYAKIHKVNYSTVRSYVKRGTLTVVDRDGRHTYLDSEEKFPTSYWGKCGKQPQLSNILRGMKSRCYNPKHHSYKYYGGKGVEVCPSWRNDTGRFINWAYKHGYAPGLTIDRIDPDGNYSPQNCRWITKSENSRRAALSRPKKNLADRVAYLERMARENLENEGSRVIFHDAYPGKLLENILHFEYLTLW